MSFYRVYLISLFDLKNNLFSSKGLFFLIPFALFWYAMLTIFSSDSTQILDYLTTNEPQNLITPDQLTQITNQLLHEAVSQKYGLEVANSLFLDKPRLLSFTYLCGLLLMPAFAFLAGHNQFASDTHRGAFRFLLTRCTRLEIFLGRFISSWVLFISAFFILIAICLIILFKQSVFQANTDIIFSIQLWLGLFFYGTCFIAFSSIISAISRSGIGALLLCITVYVILLTLIAILNNIHPLANYLSPSALKESLYIIKTENLLLALSLLLLYILPFLIIAYFLFKSRNL